MKLRKNAVERLRQSSDGSKKTSFDVFGTQRVNVLLSARFVFANQVFVFVKKFVEFMFELCKSL